MNSTLTQEQGAAPLVLDAQDLSIRFGGVHALKGVSVQVRRGEIVSLIGENGCGKSTFTKIVSGVYTPNTGTVTVDGVQLDASHPRAAIAAGVQVIYQDLSLFDHLTVAENIAINRLLHDGSRMLDRHKMRQIASEQLAKVGVKLDLEEMVGSISIANKQVVAICRALAMEAKVLFMDEPTTALTTNEVQRLLSIVTQLSAEGIAVVFISHKLDEVMQVANKVTVFRDGEKVGDFPAADITEEDLSYYMTGRRVSYERYIREQDDENELLTVSHLSRKEKYKDVSFRLRPGDILGVTGLLGSGRTEVALSLYGLNKPDGGSIKVNGKQVKITSPTHAKELGISFVSESRQTQGLFNSFSVAQNSSANQLERIVGPVGLLSRRREKELADAVIASMGVNNKDSHTIVANLSGGNQQKVVIGREIATRPSIYLLDSPTVGVDIGAKAEIYSQIHEMAKAGCGVVLISDEPEEIVANCNEVLVMHAGEVVAQFGSAEVRDPDFKHKLSEIIANPDAAGDSQPETEVAK